MKHHEPKLEHYPKFIREIITEPHLMHGLLPYTLRRDEPLRKVFELSRKDPVSGLVFELTIELIRERFERYAMWNEIERLKEQVELLKKEL